MKKIHYAVLYTSFLLFANALSANETKFAKLNNQKFGDMKKMTIANNTTSAPKTIFFDTGGKELTLNDFKGRLTLVNFWATWCAPCLEEMPSLSNLQKIKGSEKFNVVTIATMRNSPKSVEKFFDKMSIDNLTKYQDPKGKLARSLKIAGLPLSILLNKDNQEVARFIGDADWSGPHALKLIDKATEVDLKN